MKLSKFGQRMTRTSGISELMADLGEALAGDAGMRMLGGGNPAYIPEVQQRFREEMQRILGTTGAFERMIGNYDTPQGNRGFIEALAALLNRELGWPVKSANIALTNGSQSAFFTLFNLFAGECADGSYRKILLPVTPEYIGYADVGLTEDFFRARRPLIEQLDAHTFKYHLDFKGVEVPGDVGAICVSRPTNPTGNVLTDDEVAHLSELARRHDVPLILDNAYGLPFPDIIFTEAQPVWNERTIICMSLSKLGLPSARTGIVIASEEIIRAVCEMNGILALAPGTFGAALTTELVRSGEIMALSREVVKPFYQEKVRWALEVVRREFEGVDYRVHKPEGAIFLWFWFPGLPISSRELYERLKRRKVLVVGGHYFFPGLTEEWRHKQECIRVTYSQDKQVVAEGLRIIAEEVKRAFSEG
ncbi:MAG TPA: valine--pyruvate transaminase [Candidatus Sumerlaeota bacterium]|nr:valine--pyruvate transaminase [Candidatus Sumerlaeota bacterium]